MINPGIVQEIDAKNHAVCGLDLWPSPSNWMPLPPRMSPVNPSGISTPIGASTVRASEFATKTCATAEPGQGAGIEETLEGWKILHPVGNSDYDPLNSTK